MKNTGMLLQRTVVIIAALMLITSVVGICGDVSNVAEIKLTTKSQSIRYSSLSNVAKFTVNPAQMIKVYPTSDVIAITKNDSIVIEFNAKVYKKLKEEDSPPEEFRNEIEFYIDRLDGPQAVNWRYSWHCGPELNDTLIINFDFQTQARYILYLKSLKDGLGNLIPDTKIAFYTTLDYTKGVEIFRRDKYGGVTSIKLEPNSIKIDTCVIRIGLPSEMRASTDIEEYVIDDDIISRIQEANSRAEKEGLVVLDNESYKFYREFTLFSYDSELGQWIDYFDSDSDNLTDTDKLFNKKALIKMPYDPAQVVDYDENGFRIYRLTFSPRTNGWYWLRISTSRKGKDGDYVYAYVDHFSIYTILYNSPPSKTKLYQNYPNPFNPDIDKITKIDFDLHKSAYITAEIYTIMGELVRTLRDRELFDASDQYWYNLYSDAPNNVIKWDGRNDHGKTVSTGVYILRFVAEYTDGSKPYEAYRKIVVIR